MLFNYELKKIWRRVSPILVAIVLGATALATLILTAIFFNKTPAEKTNVTDDYAALETKIQNWETSIDHAEFVNAFNAFYRDYRALNASTLYENSDEVINKYNAAKTSFNQFYIGYYQTYIQRDHQDINAYLLIRSEYMDIFEDILQHLDKFFDYNNPSVTTINDGLRATNPQWQDASLEDVLDNLFTVQEISADDLTVLKQFFVDYPANQQGYDYTDAYDYILNRYWLAVANGTEVQGNLSDYKGFEDYRNMEASTRACDLAAYRLANPNEDFADPYTFGNIFNNSRQVSLFDFIFTNMEMAMLPLTFLVMIWAACAFFTDHYQNTLITPIAAGKKRSTIILTKTAVVLMLMAATIVVMAGIYAISGLLFFHAYVSPDILFLFNGTKVTTMSSINYFALYFLNLVFKLLPLIALCGLFSFVKNKPFVIVGFTTLICVIVVLLNALLGQFSFYQYVPLMGLDPLRYFGAQMLFAPMPENYNLLYTVPTMVGITVVLYWALIHIFRRHDF